MVSYQQIVARVFAPASPTPIRACYEPGSLMLLLLLLLVLMLVCRGR